MCEDCVLYPIQATESKLQIIDILFLERREGAKPYSIYFFFDFLPPRQPIYSSLISFMIVARTLYECRAKDGIQSRDYKLNRLVDFCAESESPDFTQADI